MNKLIGYEAAAKIAKHAVAHKTTVREAVERSPFGENSEALYLTSGYVQRSAESAAQRFAGDFVVDAVDLTGFSTASITDADRVTPLRSANSPAPPTRLPAAAGATIVASAVRKRATSSTCRSEPSATMAWPRAKTLMPT